MTTLPIAGWHASLADMESALADTLAALDRYQAGWENVLANQENDTRTTLSPDLLHQRLRDWDDQLLAATELAASVERELHDREHAIIAWRDSVRGGNTPSE